MQSLTPTPSATSMNDDGNSAQRYLFPSYFSNKFYGNFQTFFHAGNMRFYAMERA